MVVGLSRPDTGSGAAREASEADGPVHLNATLPAMERKGQESGSGRPRGWHMSVDHSVRICFDSTFVGQASRVRGLNWLG